MTLREAPKPTPDKTGVSALELLLDSEWAEVSLETLLLRRFGRQALVYTAPYAYSMAEPGEVPHKIVGDYVQGVARFCCTQTIEAVDVARQPGHTFGVIENTGETVLILRNFTELDSERVVITPDCTVPTVASYNPYIGLPLTGDSLLFPARFSKISEQPVYIPPQLKLVE